MMKKLRRRKVSERVMPLQKDSNSQQRRVYEKWTALEFKSAGGRGTDEIEKEKGNTAFQDKRQPPLFVCLCREKEHMICSSWPSQRARSERIHQTRKRQRRNRTLIYISHTVRILNLLESSRRHDINLFLGANEYP